MVNSKDESGEIVVVDVVDPVLRFTGSDELLSPHQ
jgi:hypothetical protein